MPLYGLALASFIWCLPANVFAKQSGPITFHTQEWKGVTNRDGSGLYNDIMRALFTPHGLTVKNTYVPFRRAIIDVEWGVADIAGGTNNQSTKYIRSRYPIWVSRSSALFRKELLPEWQGFDTIATNQDLIVSAPHLGEQIGLDVYEVRNRPLGIKMLLRGHMQYYVDDNAILIDLVKNKGEGLAFEEGETSKTLGDVDWSQFVIREIKTKEWYMVFPNNERGRWVRNIFDSGFKKLHKTGELQKMYDHWGLGDCAPKELATDVEPF